MERVSFSCGESVRASLERDLTEVRSWVEGDSSPAAEEGNEVVEDPGFEGVLSALVEWVGQQLSATQVVRARRHFETALQRKPQSGGLQMVVNELERALQRPRPRGLPPGCGPLL